jgi:aspartate-semialdehyde dehydrogenase
MTATRPFRIAIVGASSLAGKELSDTLAESSLAASDVVLLDIEEEAAGQVTAAGDEATFIQKLDADSFARMDFVFFTGDPQTTKKYWKPARLAGASIIDMTYALEAEPGVLVRGPLAQPAPAEPSPAHANPVTHGPDLSTPAVVAAHPAALMLLLIAARIHDKLSLQTIAATLFEPASEHGRAAMDELHQQTVALLSFQSLPRQQYDAQVAFNLLPSLGESAKVNLAATQSRILTHYATLFPAPEPSASEAINSTSADTSVAARTSTLTLQLTQAPVFHGYVASVFLELDRPATIEQVEAALHGEHIDILGPESDPPSNVAAAGQPDVLVSVRSAEPGNNPSHPQRTEAGKSAIGDAPSGDGLADNTPPGDGASTRFWLWLAADNLKLAALNAIACANELRRLRPQGKVQ